MLIICHCFRCRRQQVYWAADLVEIGAGGVDVARFGLGCAHCGELARTRTRAHYPGPNDTGRFEILRPAGVEQTQLWRREWFENPPAPLKDGDVLVRQAARRT